MQKVLKFIYTNFVQANNWNGELLPKQQAQAAPTGRDTLPSVSSCSTAVTFTQ